MLAPRELARVRSQQPPYYENDAGRDRPRGSPFQDLQRVLARLGSHASNRDGASRISRGPLVDYSASESAKEFFPLLTQIERQVSREFGFLMRQ